MKNPHRERFGQATRKFGRRQGGHTMARQYSHCDHSDMGHDMGDILKHASSATDSGLIKHNEEAVKHSIRTGMNLMLHSPAAKMVATGVVISTTKNTGKSILSLLAKHPVITFGLGISVGYFIRKYRKDIIEIASSRS